jgi:hypothetical protein
MSSGLLIATRIRIFMFSRVFSRLSFLVKELHNRWRLYQITRQVARHESQKSGQKLVVFFNASTRLEDISMNAAFSAITAWGFRLSGIPVAHFICHQGMSRCVLGSDPDDYLQESPCGGCIAQSKRLYAQSDVHWFEYEEPGELAIALNGLSVDEMMAFEYHGRPLGQIVLPSIRWRMRRHHLEDDEPTRFLYREFILSAYHVGQAFAAFLDRVDPCAVILFNGLMFPEAMARQVAQARGIPVVTHEIGYQPFSGFFSTGEAPTRVVDLPDEFELSEAQNIRLDAYLEQRFEGEFTIAGIKFWRDISGLDPSFLEKAAQFKQVVPVFTNVVFDTSQPYANVIFEHMFAWLDLVLEIIKEHPETLFVLRAHPDELRPDSKKKSRETVGQWVQKNRVLDLPNVVFVDALEYLSSYALIRNSKFVMVYNSQIGLEGTLLGRPVICAGDQWYTPYSTVFYPKNPQALRQQVEKFLAAEEIEIPEEFLATARRLTYFQNFRVALPFGDYLENHGRRGYVRFKSFPIDQLNPEHSPAVRVVCDGVLDGHTVFALQEEL